METTKPSFVLPGDLIAHGEEFTPGEGTYEVDGKVYAATAGSVELDAQTRTARVLAVHPTTELRVGDYVYGTVRDLKGSMVIVDVHYIEGNSRPVPGIPEASIHVSKVSDRYTEDLGQEFRLADIVRARVVQVEPSIQLSTVDRRCGVVLAYCMWCRRPLELKGRDLYCANDDRREPRKLAPDYDNSVWETKP